MCSFYVTAWDGLSFHNQTKVTAIFQDMNDNKPVFENNTYEGSVIEGFNKGSEVIDKHGKTLVVKATDADFGDNAKISYSIVETSARQFFSIQPQTGVLKTKQVRIFRIYPGNLCFPPLNLVLRCSINIVKLKKPARLHLELSAKVSIKSKQN